MGGSRWAQLGNATLWYYWLFVSLPTTCMMADFLRWYPSLQTTARIITKGDGDTRGEKRVISGTRENRPNGVARAKQGKNRCDFAKYWTTARIITKAFAKWYYCLWLQCRSLSPDPHFFLYNPKPALVYLLLFSPWNHGRYILAINMTIPTYLEIPLWVDNCLVLCGHGGMTCVAAMCLPN